ncbi:hypothetical protein H6763_00455 [Candidatus Nomurabacteria bacterium]|nr:hypothetical protein [Candidatus Nomurabacteria bacterium]MCB9803284.1 hypothetical protein [Candidatus Nomurabacteria bacterium]
MSKYIWPPKEQRKYDNYMGLGVHIYEQMFGSLSDEPDSPYRRISIANIGFSLDPTKGCPLRCSYCVRLSNKVDGLFDDEKNIQDQKLFQTLPKVEVDGDVLIKNLIKHPTFFPNEAVISISTGSSEAFAPVSEEQTIKILEELRHKQNLANPVWIVTKLGINQNHIKKWAALFTKYTKQGPIILSVTSSGLPSEIESYQADRFKFVEDLQQSGVYISHHLRPIIRGINDSEEILRSELQRSLPLVKSVCVGGLRMDPGIKIAWQDINKLDPNLLPNKPGEKDLPENVVEKVRRFMDELGYSSTPLFIHSSHVIAHATEKFDHCLQEFAGGSDKEVVLTIPKVNLIKDVQNLKEIVAKTKNKLNLECEIAVKENTTSVKITTNDSQLFKDYRIKKLFIQTVGHYNNVEKVMNTDILSYWKKYNEN